jgi:succinoglycan biosynthesis transport protein ExoP
MDSQKNKPASVLDLWDVARRRKFQAIIPALLVIIAVSIYVYTAPPKFQAKSLIAVEAGTDAANPTPDPSAKVQSQLRTVREVVFEGPLFQSVIQEFDLLKTVPQKDPARALDTLKSRVSIEVDGADAFYLGYEGANRQQTADVANRIAELFVAQTSARHELQTTRETQVTDSGVDRLRAKLVDLDSRIENYKQGAVEELPERADSNLKQIEVFQAQIQDRSTALASEDARRAGVVSEMTEIEKKGMLNLPVEAASKSANQIKLEDARLELEGLKARYTSSYPEVSRKESEVRDLEKIVAAEPKQTPTRVVSPTELRYTQLKADLDAIDRHMSNIRQERTALTTQMANSRQHVNATPRHEQALAQLTREYEITKAEYGAALQKQIDTHRDEQLEKIANNGLVFRVVEPARVPLDPVSPNRLRLLVLGLLAGFGFGIAMAFLAEHVDSSFRDVDEFQTETGLSVLSMIPTLKARGVSKKKQADPKSLSHQYSEGGYRPASTIVTILDPQSVATEQYQILAMRLRNSAKGTKCPIFLVTSSAGGEGKTVSSINLAVALSEQSRVLLIDADLRRPKVHQYLGFPVMESRGLGNLLFNPEDNLAKYTRTVDNLSILPGGGHVEHPLTLLASPKLGVLMTRLRDQFEYIIVDSPPIMPVADGLILRGITDQVLIVVRAGYTARAVLRRALNSLDTSHLAGVILNDFDIRHSRYAYAYKYYQKSYLRRT